jgi:hypothetical protein
MVPMLGLEDIGTAPEYTRFLRSPRGKLCRGVMSGSRMVSIMKSPGVEQDGPQQRVRCERRSALG